MEMIPPDQRPTPDEEAGPVPMAEPETGAIGVLDRYLTAATKVLFYIAGIGLTGMLLLVLGDVIGIKIFSKPVPGGIEFVSFLSVVTIAFAVPFTQVMRGHVSVDFIVEHFPRRARLLIDTLTILFGIALFVMLTWYSFKYAGNLRESGEVSMTQKLPFYPFVYGMAVSMLAVLLLLVLDLCKQVRKVVTTWTR
jgi:TRAP-type C4-dicarboxylate transport system permease small subunit